MTTFIKRVEQEQAELNEKIIRLSYFIGGDVFYTLPESEQQRLIMQDFYMRKYLRVLNSRIHANFK